jgi:hypothetical protein
MQHYCEFGHTNGMLGIEPCGARATGKFRGRWFCEDHLETMESNAELTDALANVSNEEAAESAAQFDADLEEL